MSRSSAFFVPRCGDSCPSSDSVVEGIRENLCHSHAHFRAYANSAWRVPARTRLQQDRAFVGPYHLNLRWISDFDLQSAVELLDLACHANQFAFVELVEIPAELPKVAFKDDQVDFGVALLVRGEIQ